MGSINGHYGIPSILANAADNHLGLLQHLHAVKDVLVLGTADAPEPDWAVEFTLKCNVNTDKIKPVDVDVAGVAVSLTDVVVG